MPKAYSAKSSGLQPYIIPDETVFAIGRLIRACAELEDVLTLYLGKLSKLGEGQLTILLGVTAVSKKIELSRTFAAAHGEASRLRFEQLFDNDVFKEIWRTRNIAAHGVLLGLSDDGLMTFRTQTIAATDPSNVHLEAVGLTLSHFQKVAMIAEQAIGELENFLDVRTSREKRRLQPLSGHKKGQPTRPPSPKRKPPRSS